LLFLTKRQEALWPEVGLLSFARHRSGNLSAVLPRYRSRFSKDQFNSHRSCWPFSGLMRYEDWPFGEPKCGWATVANSPALGLVSVPDFTTLYRLPAASADDVAIDRAVGETVGAGCAGTRRKGRGRAPWRSTPGLAGGSGEHVLRARGCIIMGKKPLAVAGHWLKWVVVVDFDQAVCVVASSCDAARGTIYEFGRPVVEVVPSKRARLVLADAEFDNEKNTPTSGTTRGAKRIPAKRGKETWRHPRSAHRMHRAFPRRLYRRRSLIESLFSSVSANSRPAADRSLRTQKRQAYCSE